MKKKIFFISFIFIFAIVFYATNVLAGEKDTGAYCLDLNVDYDDGFTSANVVSIKVNENDWEPGDRINGDPENGKLWTIEFVLTKNGEDYPFVSTAAGIVVEDENDPNYPGYGAYKAIPNPANENQYIITVTLNEVWPNKGTTEPKVCGGYGVTIKSGPPITVEPEEVTSNVTITIIGDELEYHYVEDKPNEADVTYFKFDINGGTEEARLVPFTFGNADYTYNDNEPPKNVDMVTTKQAIPYKYMYDNSGYVDFCVNGGGTDEYTSIKINEVEYVNKEDPDKDYVPHTKEQYWESLDGGAQMFCIPDVPYSTSYNVVVEGKQTSDENKIPGFGWSYLTKEISADITDEGNFAHGRLEFVSASLVIDGEEEIFGSARSFDNYRYHDKGQIFMWRDGNKAYTEEDRRMAWGEARMPYGTKIRVRIVPDKGYQLTGLTVSENGFLPTETPGEYELTLTRTNLSYNEDNNQFDLNPTFEKVDATASSKSSAVSNVVLTINKGENAFDTGTPRLDVTDVASMSPERQQDFADSASEGYTIDKYLEISLYNTLYKGGKKNGTELESWDTEIHELQNNATIGLKLEEALNGGDVEVIHEVRNDENKIVGYDVIEAEYDQENNIITFETDGFSTYAISVKTDNNNNNGEDNNNNNNSSNPDGKDIVKIEFDARCPECFIEPVELEIGTKLSKPKDPVNGELEFVGWYDDEEYHNLFDFDKPVEKSMTLYAKWNDKIQEYNVKDNNGNSITFKEIKNRSYSFSIVDVLPMSDEELAALGASRELFNEVKSNLIKLTSEYGDLLAFYQIDVKDSDDGTEIHEGPFTIRIKLTDEMKKYNVFKMVYINDEFATEDVIELEIDGEYLVGVLPHLSSYTLSGKYVEPTKEETKEEAASEEVTETKTGDSNVVLPDTPKTYDNISSWLILLITSVFGIIVSVVYIKKTSKSKVR